MINFELTLCSHRGAAPETIGCIERFRLSTKLIYYLAVYAGDALLSRNRSIACSHFLENNFAPYMVFLDDDIIFTANHLEKIHQDLSDGYDIVGGAYPVRDGSQLASFGWGGQVVFDASIQEIEYLATGFMGISRRALIKIRDELKLPLLNPNDWSKCYPFFECGRCTERKGDPIYISEDWDFCEKARKVGLKVYLDTAVQVNHLGSKQYGIADIMEAEKKRQEEKAHAQEVGAPSAEEIKTEVKNNESANKS